MKLRIRGNSVRMRVSRSELARIAETGAAEDAVRFSPSVVLRYGLEVVPEGPPRARLAGSEVRISLPRGEVERWLAEDRVSIRGEQSIGEGQTLKILVEKDFACLAPRTDEEEEGDLFRNPRAETEGH